MPPRRWQWQGSPLATWSLVLTFAVIWSVVGALGQSGAASASTAHPGVALKVSSPYSVRVAPGTWVPVVVSLTNKLGTDLQGELLVTSSVPQLSGGVPYCYSTRGAGTACVYPGLRSSGWFAYGANAFGSSSSYGNNTPTSQVTYRAPIDLAPGTTKHIELAILAAAQPSNVSARVALSSGRVIAEANGQVQVGNSVTPPSVLVVTDNPSVLSSLSWPVPGGPQAQVQLLAPSQLPGSSAVLGAFAAIVIDEADTSVLTEAQGLAVEAYVDEGGTLVVGGGLSWATDVAGLPTSLLPAQVVGTQSTELTELGRVLGASAPGQAAPVDELRPSPGKGASTFLSEGSTPLAVEAGRGSGHVVVAAIDPAAAPLAGWAGDGALDSRLTAPAYETGYAGASPVVFAGSGFGVTVAAPAASLDAAAGAVGPQQAGEALTPYLFQMPGGSLPKPEVLGLLLLGYVVVVGPVCFLVLRRIRRRELAWVAVPCLAAVTVVLSYTTGAGIAVAPRSNEVELARLAPGGHLAQVTSLGAVYLARGGSGRVDLAARSPTGGQQGSTFGGLPGGAVSDLGVGAGAKLTVDEGSPGSEVLQVSGPSNSLGGWAAAEDATVKGSLPADFGQSGSAVHGMVTNRLGVGLEDVTLSTASGQQRQLGSLADGASVTFSFPVPSATTGSGQGATVVPVFLVGGSERNGPASTRQQAAEQGLAELAHEYSAAIGGWPVLVGLADRQFLPPARALGSVALTTTDAVVLPLVPTADPRARLAGLAPELVGSTGLTGAVALGAASGTLALAKGGSLDLQFSLPASHWRELKLDLGSPAGSSNTQGFGSQGTVAGFALASGSPAKLADFSLSAFDYRSGDWNRLPAFLGTGGAIAGGELEAVLSHPGPYIGPGGAVELRLSALVDGLQVFGAVPTLTALPALAQAAKGGQMPS